MKQEVGLESRKVRQECVSNRNWVAVKLSETD